MIDFLSGLRVRNRPLFWFGMASVGFAAVCLLLSRITGTQVFNVNAWIKPFKFACST